MYSTAYPYRITVPPVGDPLFITLDEARSYLSVPNITDISDNDLTAFIRAAQAATERFTRLTLFTTTFETTRDFFHFEMRLRRAPLISVGSIKRLVNDVLTTVSTGTYKIIDFAVLNFGSIVLRAGQIWPSDQDAELRAITITFNAGFGVDASFLPDDLINGMKRLLADFYENRGDCSCDASGALQSMSPSAMALLGRFKIMEI